MGSGLSMTSVNKIKELAMSREYSLALEIIDSQDLSKSLNPQFIRLCGEVYVANKRYKDARRVFLMAHRMAPEAKRVIFSLSDLYFRMGYKDLAEFYYNLYMFDAESNLPQTNQMNYIYSKAQGCPFQEIETLLFPMYSDVMDYDWSYELYLLMKMQGKDAEATAIKNDYVATFKTEQNSEIMEELEQSPDRLEELFYIYPKEAVADDDPEQEELRQEEKPLLEADDNRINPKEAEIQIVFDDNEKASFGAKLKYKKHLKEQEKLARQAEKGEGTEEQGSNDTSEEQPSVEETVEFDYSQSEEQQDLDGNSNEKVNIFKKLFTKKKNENVGDIVSEETNNNEVEAENNEEHTPDTEAEEEKQEESLAIAEQPEDEQLKSEGAVSKEVVEEAIVDLSKDEVHEDEYDFDFHIDEFLSEDSVEEETEVEEEPAENEMILEEDNSDEEVVSDEQEDDFDSVEVETATEEESEQVIIDDMGDSVMQEIYGKKKISIVTELGEDTFVNVSEFDSNTDIGNPFDELLGYEKKSSVEETDAETDGETKSSFVFEEVQLEPEDDIQYEVDDFSQGFQLTDFEKETTEAEGFSDTEASAEEYVEEITEESLEEDVEETVDLVTEEIVEEAVEETVEKIVEEPIEKSIKESIEETVEETPWEATEDSVEEAVEEITEEVLDETADEYFDISDSDSFDSETDEVEEDYVESVEPVAEAQEEKMYSASAFDSLKGESVYDSLKKKGNMDFPEFKTTLFPEYGQQVAEVENNFNEIMSQAQDKINENLLKEEQMQREAEALLASLGIDIESIKPTVNPVNTGFGSGYVAQPTSTQQVEPQMVEPSSMAIEPKTEETQEEAPGYSPSRDELKASLKIDSVKKSILKQIKEYR